jgi:hypothetical protein
MISKFRNGKAVYKTSLLSPSISVIPRLAFAARFRGYSALSPSRAAPPIHLVTDGSLDPPRW